MKSDRAKAIASALLEWFAASARDLPWRRTNDPYAIWVSEIMLQQTQVKTVIPYWGRWMEAFPTAKALAEAPLDRVLKLWEGLGYYARARNLHRAAQIAAAFPNGFPSTFDEILALPGVGRYTAGAIFSIAFNQPAPILDGNVARVLSRLFALSGNPRAGKTNERLWELAEALVQTAARLPEQGRNCSGVNQALMELGALVCAPAQPKCLICPVRQFCAAHQKGLAHLFPEAAPRPRTIARFFRAAVLQRENEVWVRQRPEGVVNAGLWEFPNLEMLGDGSIRWIEGCVGMNPGEGEKLCEILHTITRYRITLEVFRFEVSPRQTFQAQPGTWVAITELDNFAFPSAHKKIVRLLQKTQKKAA